MVKRKSPDSEKQSDPDETTDAAAKANKMAAMTAASIVGKRRLTPPPQT
jgi:hypothetical protein